MFWTKTIRVALKLGLVMLLSLAAAGQHGRTVQGMVTDENGTALKGAVVQLRNMRSLWVRSYICQDEGRYRFVGLSPDVYYEVKAAYNGRWSEVKTVSRYDSEEAVEVNLVVEAGDARRSGPPLPVASSSAAPAQTRVVK